VVGLVAARLAFKVFRLPAVPAVVVVVPLATLVLPVFQVRATLAGTGLFLKVVVAVGVPVL
jgi:hypothetical protein